MSGQFVRWAGSVLGLGFLPAAPGTWGSLGGVALWWLTLPLGPPAQALLLIVAVVPSALVCSACARGAGENDPAFVVLDEMLGMWLALLFVKPSWPWAAASFALFRFLDIAKPWPVSLVERRFPGGPGILLDDLVAGAITGIIVFIIQYFINGM